MMGAGVPAADAGGMRPWLQRVLGAFLITLQIGALAVTLQGVLMPLLLLMALALALLPSVRLALGRRGRLTAYVVLGVSAYVTARLVPLSARSFSPLMEASAAHAIAHYLVALQILHLALYKKNLPWYFPVMAIVGLTFAGSIVNYGRIQPVFPWMAPAAVVAILAYAQTMTAPGAAGKVVKAPAVLRGLCVLSVIGIGVTTAHLLKRYQDELDAAFSRLVAVEAASSRPGMSDPGKLDSVTAFRGDNEHAVALRVVTPGPPGYLRANAFSSFVGGQWTRGVERWRRLPEGAGGAVPGASGPARLFTVRQGGLGSGFAMEVWPAAKVTGPLFGPLAAAGYSVPADEILLDDNLIAEAPGLHPGQGFEVHVLDSVPFTPAHRATLTAASGVPPALREAVAGLADRLFAEARTPHEKMAAVLGYFSGYQYALGLAVPSGQDPLAFFLLEKPPAHCEFFAAGAAMLLRMGGVPARYVTGVVPTEYNPYGEYWMARNKDAHAWVEAYDPAMGWVTLDATPGAGQPREVSRSYAAYAWDTVKFRVQEFTVLVRSNAVAATGRLLRHLGVLTARVLLGGWLGIGVALGVLGLLLGLILWRRRGRRRAGYAYARHPMQADLRWMDKRLRRHGFTRGRSETLHQFAARIESAPGGQAWAHGAAAWYRVYARSCYGGARGGVSLARPRAF
jgi:protein-glutamine gamma-glutamyltransferase